MNNEPIQFLPVDRPWRPAPKRGRLTCICCLCVIAGAGSTAIVAILMILL